MGKPVPAPCVLHEASCAAAWKGPVYLGGMVKIISYIATFRTQIYGKSHSFPLVLLPALRELLKILQISEHCYNRAAPDFFFFLKSPFHYLNIDVCPKTLLCSRAGCVFCKDSPPPYSMFDLSKRIFELFISHLQEHITLQVFKDYSNIKYNYYRSNTSKMYVSTFI